MKGSKGDVAYYFGELKISLKRCYEAIKINDNEIVIDEANIRFTLENKEEVYFIYEYFY